MSGWLPACLSCRFAHNKDGMPLCQNWVRSACIGGHGNSCRNRHYYTQYDAALPKPAQPAAPPSSVLTEFSSPLVTRVQKVTEHHKRVEIDLETGKRKSFIETTEQEIIDITGNKENTPVKAPVAQLSKTSKNLKSSVKRKKRKRDREEREAEVDDLEKPKKKKRKKHKKDKTSEQEEESVENVGETVDKVEEAVANVEDVDMAEGTVVKHKKNKKNKKVRSGPEEVTVIRELNFRKGRFQLIDTGLGEKTS